MDRLLIGLAQDELADALLAIGDGFRIVEIGETPEPKAGEGPAEDRGTRRGQEPRLVLAPGEHDADRIALGQDASGSRQQVGTEFLGAIVVGVEQDEYDVGPTKMCEADVMLDAPSGPGRCGDGTATRRADGAVDMHFDVPISAELQPAPDQDRDGLDLSVSLDDRHDDVPGHGVNRS